MSATARRLGIWRAEHLIRTSVGIVFTNGLNLLLGYAFWLVAARIAAPSVVGVGAALIAAFNTAAILTNAGFTGALLQLLPARRDDLAWGRTLTAALLAGGGTGLVGGALTSVALALCTDTLRRTPTPWLTGVLLAVSVSVWTMCSLMDIAFVAERASGLALARNALFSVIRGILLFGVALVHADPALLLATWTLASAVSLAASYVIGLRRLGRPLQPVYQGVLGDLRALRGMLIGHYAIVVGLAVPAQILPTIVEARAGATTSAYFYAAWMMGGVFFIVAPSVAQPLLSELSHDPAARRATLRRAAIAVGALLAPAMIVFALAARPILSTFGPGYTAATAIVLPLIISAIPDGLTSLQVSIWRADNRRGIAAVEAWVSAIVAVAGAWWLVPHHGLTGAVWAWTAGQTAGLLICAGDHVHSRLRPPAPPPPPESGLAREQPRPSRELAPSPSGDLVS